MFVLLYCGAYVSTGKYQMIFRSWKRDETGMLILEKKKRRQDGSSESDEMPAGWFITRLKRMSVQLSFHEKLPRQRRNYHVYYFCTFVRVSIRPIQIIPFCPSLPTVQRSHANNTQVSKCVSKVHLSVQQTANRTSSLCTVHASYLTTLVDTRILHKHREQQYERRRAHYTTKHLLFINLTNIKYRPFQLVSISRSSTSVHIQTHYSFTKNNAHLPRLPRHPGKQKKISPSPPKSFYHISQHTCNYSFHFNFISFFDVHSLVTPVTTITLCYPSFAHAFFHFCTNAILHTFAHSTPT